VRIGVIFPQTEIGSDPSVLRDYAQAAEGLGFNHLLAYDHVLGAEPSGRPPGWRGAYTNVSNFHEPLTLFAYLGAITRRIEFVTGILILPQRQTALVAKQAAEVDILTGGRLRLGVGIGWNHVEYEALNENFHNRGRRSEEQVRLLRMLWTNELIDFQGKWHRIDRAGLKPLPQRPIPIWFGGGAPEVLKRISRHGDGWFPQAQPDQALQRTIENLRAEALAAGRTAEDIGIEGRVSITSGTPEDWARLAEQWRALGATHLGVNTMSAGLASPRDHIEAIRRVKDALGVGA